MLAAAMPVEAITPEKFARHILLDPNYRADGALVAKAGNCVAGFIYSAMRREPLNEADARKGYITAIGVDQRYLRQGIGTQLIAAAEAQLQQSGRTELLVSPYAPAYFTPGVDLAAYPAAIELFTKQRFEQVSRPIAMQANLWKLTEPQFVADARKQLTHDHVCIEPYSPPLTQPILQFARNEFGADWEIVYRDAMRSILRGEASASRIALAHRAGTVLGITHHDGERFGPIGVAASARGRGIGQVLMYETLQTQRRAGLQTAWFLWSDDRTADRLYRGAGFSEFRRYVIFRKALRSR